MSIANLPETADTSYSAVLNYTGAVGVTGACEVYGFLVGQWATVFVKQLVAPITPLGTSSKIFIVDALPAYLRPSIQLQFPIVAVDNSANILGVASFQTTGTIELFPAVSGFYTAATVVILNFSVTYPLF